MRMVVAYDGSRVPRLRAPARTAHRGRRARPRHLELLPAQRRAGLRGQNRLGGPRPGSGGARGRRIHRSIRSRSSGRSTGSSRRRSSCARSSSAPAGFDARHSASEPLLPVPRPRSARTRPAARRIRLARRRCARPAGDAGGGRRPFRRARLQGFLPQATGPPPGSPIPRRVLDTRWSVASFLDRELGELGDLRSIGTSRTATASSGRRHRHRDGADREDGRRRARRATAALRRTRNVVLPPDGPVHRRRARRGRPGPHEASDIPRLLASGNRPGRRSLPRRTGCA